MSLLCRLRLVLRVLFAHRARHFRTLSTDLNTWRLYYGTRSLLAELSNDEVTTARQRHAATHAAQDTAS